MPDKIEFTPRSILIYANYGVYIDPESGELYLPSIHHRYLEALNKVGFEKIVLITKTTKIYNPKFDKQITISGFDLVELPWFNNYGASARYFSKIRKVFAEVRCCQFDRVFVRVFEPFAWMLVILFALRDRKFTRSSLIMHFISDPRGAIFGNRGQSFAKKFFRYLVFLPEYILTILVTLLCRPTANGPVPSRRIPRLFSRRFTQLIESALLQSDLDDVFSKRQDRGGRHSPFRILFVGYLRNSKGIDTLLSAISILESRGEGQFHFHIVGDGEMYPIIENFIINEGLQSKIVLHGYVPFSQQLFELFSSSDIFVNPSVSETGPRVLLEAKVFGNYLISTDVGYSRTLISGGQYGKLFPVGDAQSLANAILEASALLAGEGWSPPTDVHSYEHNLTAEGFFKEALRL